MAEPNVIPGDLQVKGNLRAGSFSAPSLFLTNAMVAADAAIDASKLLHMVNAPVELFGPAVTITALTKLFYIAKGAGTLSAFRAFLITAATGADRTVTVDLQKSTAGGAFATVMSVTVGFTNASAIRTLVAGTFASTTYAAGDLFQIVVTVAGSASAQALGLCADLVAYEATT